MTESTELETTSPAPSAKQRIAAWVGVLFVVAVVGVIDMPAESFPADPYFWRQEAYSILKNGSLSVDPAAQQGLHPYVQNPRNGRWYSKYGPMNAIMSLPPVWIEQLFDPRPTPSGDTSVLILDLWNVVLGVALAAVLMLIAGRFARRLSTRVFFVFACLYATYLWYYLRAQSGEIYQALFFGCLFLLLTRFLGSLQGHAHGAKLDLLALAGAWTFAGMLVFTRVLFILLIPLLVLYVAAELWRLGRQRATRIARRFWPHVLLPAAVLLLLVGWLHYTKFGSPLLSGYHQWEPEMHYPTGRLWDGVWGMLFLPRFSVFLYFPPVAFGALALRESYRRRRVDTIVAVGMFAAFVLALGKVPTWAGEWTYGPRYILFALPPLATPFIVLTDRVLDELRAKPHLAQMGLTALIAAALIHSAYLQFRVNSVPFFTYYQVRIPLESLWTDTMAAYFRDHHVGTITDDLLRHRHDLDELPTDHAAMPSDVGDSVTDSSSACSRTVLLITRRTRRSAWPPPAGSARESDGRPAPAASRSAGARSPRTT